MLKRGTRCAQTSAFPYAFRSYSLNGFSERRPRTASDCSEKHGLLTFESLFRWPLFQLLSGGNPRNPRYHLHTKRKSVSVRCPFVVRSFSVRCPFSVRSASVLGPFFVRFLTERQRKAGEVTAKSQRSGSGVPANAVQPECLTDLGPPPRTFCLTDAPGLTLP